MPMIYYTGNPDYERDDDPAPEVIRATDEAGNQLVSIKAGARVDAVVQPREGYEWQTEVIFDGFNVYGEAVTAWNNRWDAAPFSWRPGACAIRSDGWIFSASAHYEGVYNDDSPQTYVVLIDFFQVHRRNGDRVPFPQLHGAQIHAVVLDSEHNIIVGGEEHYSDGAYLRKYDPDGTLLWSVTRLRTSTTDQRVEQILIDSNDDLYVRFSMDGYYWGYATRFSYFAKIDSDGNTVWIKTDSQYPANLGSPNILTASDMCLLDGSLYTSAIDPLPGYTNTYLQRRSISDGSASAYASGLDRLYALATNGTELHGWCNIGQYEGSDDILNHKEFDPDDLTILDEEYSLPKIPGRNDKFLFDTQGVAHFADYKPTLYGFYDIDLQPADTVQQDPTNVYLVTGTTIPAIALPLSLALFTWNGDTYTFAPGLPLGLSLALPGLRREYKAALVLPDIYRVTLSGTPDLDIPISSFTIRRNAVSISLSIVSPKADAAQIDDLIERSEGTLILWRGVRFLDGTEQLEPMLAVDLAGRLRYDIGSRSGSVTLTGETEADAATARTRTLRGISYRSATNGSRRVRCAVDTYLRPGDTADLGGGETLTVAEITYSVSVTAATMEVAE